MANPWAGTGKPASPEEPDDFADEPNIRQRRIKRIATAVTESARDTVFKDGGVVTMDEAMLTTVLGYAAAVAAFLAQMSDGDQGRFEEGVALFTKSVRDYGDPMVVATRKKHVQ